MLSFDISDRQINIVKGDNVSNRIKIDKSLTIDIPEDMILNGEVINLSGLNEIISSNLRSNMMTDKEAVVTFSSSNIVFKELIVPKGKGSEFLTMVQNQMAQEMGLECVAEGVETPQQLQILADNNCEMAQGFIFDKPMPSEEFGSKLNSESRRYSV